MRGTGLLLLVLLAAGCESSNDVTPSPTTTDPHDLPLLTGDGDTLQLGAMDADGTWGTITLQRGEDVGGYTTDEVDPNTFIIELHVEYVPARHPAGSFGSDDWAVVDAADRLPVGGRYEPRMPANPADLDPARQPIGTWPGAVELAPGEAIRGLVAFQVPRAFEDRHLVLVYHPDGTNDVVEFLLREARQAPAIVAAATPAPRPTPGLYAARDGLPIAVLDSVEADALFATPDTCTNSDHGYTVTYPDSWYTNTEVGDVPACSWFAPTSYEVAGGVPDEVVIIVNVLDGGIGFFNIPDYIVSEQVALDGVDAWRHEQVGVTHEGGGYETLPPSYQYTAHLGAIIGDGPTLIASTHSDGEPDYVLHKAVLDRIMASIRFDR